MNFDNLPLPNDGEAWRKLIAENFALIGKPVDPKKLRDCSPLAWDTTPFPADVEL